MIIDNNTSNVEKYGDIKEYKTVIKDEDIQHIITLLSSNLYSNPIESFIREITCNAWDSQVEAGTTDLPIIIKAAREDSFTTISIRDYGTGLSEEHFEELYCSLGHSTKRHSNDFIGSFGIGRLSPLALSNTVNISSYYNGTEFKFVMIKDINSITINKLCEIPTEEKNGLKVTVTIKNADWSLTRALDKLAFFPNVYIDFTFYNQNYDNHVYRTFAVSNKIYEYSVLVGYVVYPLDKRFVNKINQYTSSSVALRFNIGELDITPNRENLIYSKKTVDAIESKIQEFLKEIQDIVFNEIKDKNFKNYRQYYKFKTQYYIKVNNCLSFTLSAINKDITFKGKNIDRYVLIASNVQLTDIRYRSVPTCSIFSLDDIPIIVLPRAETLSNYKKLYIRSKVKEEYLVLYDFDESKYKESIDNSVKQIMSDNTDFICSSVVEHIKSRIVPIDFESDEYAEYAAQIKQVNKKADKNYDSTKNSVTYVVNYSKTIRCHSYSEIKENIRRTKKGILIADTREDLKNYTYFSDKYVIMFAKKSLRESLLKEGFSNVFTKEKLLQRKHLSDSGITLVTVPYINEDMLCFLPESLKTYYTEVRRLKSLANKINFKGDKKVKIIDERLEEIRRIQEEVNSIMLKYNIYSDDIIFYILMKKKICRIDYSIYKICKQNPLIKLLSQR